MPDSDYGNRLVNDVMTVLNDNLCSAVNVDDICRITHYGRANVFKQFKAATGRSVMAYFTEMKIEAAKRLLRESDLTVSQISDRLAFDNPNYFSKTFRRLTSVSPSAYRKRAMYDR